MLNFDFIFHWLGRHCLLIIVVEPAGVGNTIQRTLFLHRLFARYRHILVITLALLAARSGHGVCFLGTGRAGLAGSAARDASRGGRGGSGGVITKLFDIGTNFAEAFSNGTGGGNFASVGC